MARRGNKGREEEGERRERVGVRRERKRRGWTLLLPLQKFLQAPTVTGDRQQNSMLPSRDNVHSDVWPK